MKSKTILTILGVAGVVVLVDYLVRKKKKSSTVAAAGGGTIPVPSTAISVDGSGGIQRGGFVSFFAEAAPDNFKTSSDGGTPPTPPDTPTTTTT